MSKQKSPIEVPTFEQYRLNTAAAIRRRRRYLFEGMLDLVETVDHMAATHQPSEIISFLKECGLTDEEVSTYMTLALRGAQEKLAGAAVGYDTLSALAASNDQEFRHALGYVHANGRLGEQALKSLRRIPEDSKISDYDHALALRGQALGERFKEIASARAAQFENSIVKLHRMMKAQRDRRGNLSVRRQAIIRHAANVLKEFDDIFPDAQVPMDEWVSVGIVDPLRRRFAEGRHSLEILSVGAFSQVFPREASQYHQWDSFDSIAFLAGIRHRHQTFLRLAPRPVRKLNAVVVRTVSGVECLGLQSAGFNIVAAFAADTSAKAIIQSNRADWPVSDVSLGSTEFVDELYRLSESNEQKTHLLYGVLRDQAFRDRGRGEDDPRQQFSHALEIVRRVKPEAFCFECSDDFLDPRHTLFRNRLLLEAHEMGYATFDLAELDPTMYGVAQHRQAPNFLGIRADRASDFQLPILSKPMRTTVGRSLVDVAFPFLTEILRTPRKARTEAQVSYRNWARTWLATFGRRTGVLNSLRLARDYETAQAHWLEKCGITVGDDVVVEPNEGWGRYSALPLTIPMLKRLQGVPQDWEFIGTYEEQVAQICQTPPPVLTKMIAHNIYAALTGEVVDIDRAVLEKLNRDTGKVAKRRFKLVPDVEDSPTKRGEEWRRHVERMNAYSLTEYPAANCL